MTISHPATMAIRVWDLREQSPKGTRYPEPVGGLSSFAGFQRRPWRERLVHALHEEKFVLHYQPIVALNGSGVTHYEALIRLVDDLDGRLHAPSEFLPYAERYGLITQIDRLVISKVASLMGGELADSDAKVAVNLSGLSISDPGVLTHVQRELARCSVDPGRLIVEITETAAICDMEKAIVFCEGIHAMGSAIALDDFGAGFASFHYLKHLPFRYLKIDGEFIRGLPSSRKDQLVVQALVALARGMGKRTIAEYVGDETTMQLLRDYGVDYAQGFQLGVPRPPVEAFAA